MSATMGTFAPWYSCSDCSGIAQPGTRALLAYWLEWSAPVGTSMGIYNCRPVRGSSSLSMHSCGRAADLGVPVTDEGHRVAYEFLDLIGPHLQRLGIQLAIFNREYGSAKNPWPTYYGGTHPHRDHIHMEQTPKSARLLTLATLRDVLGTPTGDDDMIRDGEAMKNVQGQLNWVQANSDFQFGPELKKDGVWGSKTSFALDKLREWWGLLTRDERPNSLDITKLDRTIHEIKYHQAYS